MRLKSAADGPFDPAGAAALIKSAFGELPPR